MLLNTLKNMWLLRMFGIYWLVRAPYQYAVLKLQLLLKKNQIKSHLVSLKAIRGICIEIGKEVKVDALSEIGSYSYIGDRCTVGRAAIGRYVSVGENVCIGPGEHSLVRPSTSVHFYENPYSELTQDICIIESDVWIGTGAIVLRGVRVGIGAVVAANAVVTKDVPDYAVVAGVPAKIIKFRFEEIRRNALLASKWWEKDKQEAKLILASLDGSSY